MNLPKPTQGRSIASVIAAGAMLAAPAAALAHKPGDHANKGKTKAQKSAAACAKTHDVGFSLRGTLVSVAANDPATPANEATVTLTIASANHHARQSGDIADQDATRRGVQVRGATFTVPATDAFNLRLRGYEGTDTPSVGDAVKVNGRIARTKRHCAPAGTSTADRYGAIDVRRVTLRDRDAD
jgi:hypothetical protein